MRIFLFISFLITGLPSFANMASPLRKGTLTATAFSSRDIQILTEKIHITIHKEFKTASYFIQYFIKTETDGKQIPLLFFAKDYKAGFTIWVDNKETNLLPIPSEYQKLTNNSFEKFSNSFSAASAEGGAQTTTISWQKDIASVYELNDLKYFETSLSKGEHVIQIKYTANAWTDVSGWIKEYSFRYSLSPAKFWKSFGSLEITVDGSAAGLQLTSNLGEPTSGRSDSISTWKFDKLPGEFFNLSYTAKISSFAQAMISIEPEGLTFIMALLMAIFHLAAIKKYRKSEPAKKYSWVVIAGSLVIPLLILIGYIISYELIDRAIGPEAGGHHGYTFLVIIFYPILLPLYWFIMWGADRIIKKRINSHVNESF